MPILLVAGEVHLNFGEFFFIYRECNSKLEAYKFKAHLQRNFWYVVFVQIPVLWLNKIPLPRFTDIVFKSLVS